MSGNDTNDRLRAALERARLANAQLARDPDRERGFVKWEEPDQFVDGEVTKFWRVGDWNVATVRVWDLTAPVYDSKRPVIVKRGDLVNVSLGAVMLRKTITEADVGRMVVVHYREKMKTRNNGQLKRFDVWKHDEHEPLVAVASAV